MNDKPHYRLIETSEIFCHEPHAVYVFRNQYGEVIVIRKDYFWYGAP